MRIVKVKLLEWCQHKDREFEFIPGLNGILGRNGSGKSNLLRAIPRGLMPGLASSIGIKEDDVSWGSENGKIIIVFEHCGVEYSLTRAIKGASASLKWGKEKISGASAVDDKMRALLGVGSRVFNEIIFVAQEDLTSIIFQRPADRTKTFHALLGLDNAEKIRNIITDKLAMMPADSCEELIAQLEAKKSAVAKELEEVEAAKAKVSAMSAAQRAAFQDTVTAYERWLQEEAIQASARTELKLIDDEENELLPKHAALKARIDELASLLADTSEDYVAARQRVAELEGLVQAAGARNAAQAALREAETALAAIVLPEPFDEALLKKVEKDAAEAGRKFTEIDSILKSLTSVGGAVCPVCRKPILESEIAEYRKEHACLFVPVKELCNEQTRLTGIKVLHDMALRDAEHKTFSNLAKKAAAEQTLAKLPTGSANISDLEDFKQIVSNYEALKQEHDTNLDKMGEMNTRLAAIDARRKSLQASKRPAVVAVDRGDADRAKQVLSEDNIKLAQVSKLEGQAEALRKQLADNEASITELRNREAGLAKVRKTRALMEEARGILHRDCLPAVAARAFLVSLNQSLAKQLHEFNAEFAARINDDLSFDCIFDSNIISAKRLSGGQKVTLAIATQFALYDLLAENLGILVLDEPSVYLDTDHIDCLTQLLEKVKTRAAATGLQVIVVTHEDRLKRVFDKAIEL